MAETQLMEAATPVELGPDAGQLPQHARERIAEMRKRKLFTSDLSVNEFLLVKEAGFDPLGLVMGSSIYQIAPNIPSLPRGQPGCELSDMTRALYHARELAMNRMEEEAHELGADGIVGLRLMVNLATDPQRAQWEQFRIWQSWSKRAGFIRQQPTLIASGWIPNWQEIAWGQWNHYCAQLGWETVPQPPWFRPPSRAVYGIGQNTAEFVAIGTAVRHRGGQSYKNLRGKPFQSDLDGQDFWTLIRTGYRPVGFVMGNCVYYVPPQLLSSAGFRSQELTAYTHALYDARELAIERLQDEAEALGATGIVGVTVTEKQHSWRTTPWNVGNAALQTGEIIELFVIGTAVVPTGAAGELQRPQLVLTANDRPAAKTEGE
jgi:uncharacterized protein YbjQ (UPF0145 family)